MLNNYCLLEFSLRAIECLSRKALCDIRVLQFISPLLYCLHSAPGQIIGSEKSCSTETCLTLSNSVIHQTYWTAEPFSREKYIIIHDSNFCGACRCRQFTHSSQNTEHWAAGTLLGAHRKSRVSCFFTLNTPAGEPDATK